MANADPLRALKRLGLSAPPTAGAGNIESPSALERAQAEEAERLRKAEEEARQLAETEEKRRQAEAEEAAAAAQAEADTKEKKHKGRPKLDYPTRQLGARVHAETFTRVQAIARRERVGLGPLVDRMVAAWERQRLAEAEAVGPRREGEDDDAYIARIFKL